MAYSDAVLKEMGQVLADITKDPDMRPAVVKAIKKVRPNYRAPDVEINELRADIDAKFEERDEVAEQKRALTAQARKRARIADQYGEENLPAIEGTMQKYGLGDYEAGAKLWSSDQAPAPGTAEPQVNAGWELGIDFNKALPDPFKYGRQAAYDAIREIRGGRR